MSTIVLVNGIWTHGESNVDALKAPLTDAGHRVVDVALPRRGPFRARFTAARDGRTVANHSNDGDVIVAHSFGCLRAAHAAKFREYAAIICVAPAMSRHYKWPHPRRVFCYHSNTDRALKAGALLILHPFGRAGLTGFTQEQVDNIDCWGLDHGDYFYPPFLANLAGHVSRIAHYLAP